jgi:peptidoglycan hydrolase-like protein with peptidoglycan-binding domain
LKTQRMNKDRANGFAKRTAWTSAACLGAAAFMLAVAAPADAKQKQAPADAPIADIANGQPMTLVISVGQQKIDVYRGVTLVTSSVVSTGMATNPTMMGAFSILEKQRWHHSNIYSGAPMPWMNRITWSGMAVHAGVVPGYPASHGCIRLTYAFAPKLFQITTVGDNVVVSRDRPSPTLIEHPNLFQPLPPLAPPVVAKVEEAPHLPSRDAMESNRAASAARPVILASAEVPGAATDTPPSAEAARSDSDKHATAESTANPAPIHVTAQPTPNQVHAIASAGSEETHTHAVADPSGGAGDSHALATDSARASSPAAVVPAPAASAATSIAAPPPPNSIAPEIATKIGSGMQAAAIQAAEPRSNAPLRILVTRRTKRDRIIGVQNILASLGYIEPQNFDGTIGKASITAIKAFQKANGLAETGSFTDALVKKVYEVAGKGQPEAGHLFVRQAFSGVFDAPVTFGNPDEPLGTHVYTALKFAPGDTKTQWMALNVQGTDSTSPLDRIQIPDDIRQKIAQRLTPGSSLIIADTSINSASLPKGGDFLVLAKDTPAKVAKVSASDSDSASVKPMPSMRPKPRRNVRRYYYYPGWSSPW